MLVSLLLGTLAAVAPARAVSQPPVTCNTPEFNFTVQGTATAPVLIATSYYLCTDGSVRPYGYASIGRYLIDGTYQAVTPMGQPQEEYVCQGTTKYYEYTAEGHTLYLGCG